MKLRKVVNAIFGVLICLAAALPARADVTYTFDCITSNNPVNCAAGEGQLSVTVHDAGGGQVDFIFNNSGPVASSITDVYFDDGTLLGIANITDSGAGVDFSQDASPGDLPGGNNLDPDFNATAGFTADSNPPTESNGVNPGESLTITFDLINGQTFADTIAALNGGVDLRIGIHVQAFASDGGSEGFVNTPCVGICTPPPPPPPPNPVPEPASVVLFGTALLGACLYMRKRRAA